MQSRTLRRIWFLALFLLLPWPMPVFGDALVPAVRYALLGCVTLAMAATQGASGPVVMILVLFTVMTALTTFGCWLLAWGAAKILDRLPPPARRAVTLGALACALLWALAFEPYRTAFGRALAGNLLDVLS